ncbi:MAG: hypothetical protein IKT41_02865 [Clostridia bacterium]|nr:hypothetical protein [Clostridia bacterium]
MKTKENFKKLCSFYVSDIHFGTMILPYISRKIEEKNDVYTIFEKDMNKNIEELLSGLSLNKDKKEEIRNIDWNRKTDKKEIKKYIGNMKKNNDVVLVMGDKKYIDKTNRKIEKQIKRNELKEVTIVNCYNIDIFNKNMVEILKNHNGIVNTSGERKIEV